MYLQKGLLWGAFLPFSTTTTTTDNNPTKANEAMPSSLLVKPAERSRGLIIRVADKTAHVEILPHHSLSHVRQLLIRNGFDVHQLKNSSFRINGEPISKQQETENLAFDLIRRGDMW